MKKNRNIYLFFKILSTVKDKISLSGKLFHTIFVNLIKYYLT